MGWLSRTRKRKRDDDVLEIVKVGIEQTLADWRDESGLKISVELTCVVGEDFANVSMHGFDTLKASDINALTSVENVSDVVCDLKRGSVVLRVERRHEKFVPFYYTFLV